MKIFVIMKTTIIPWQVEQGSIWLAVILYIAGLLSIIRSREEQPATKEKHTVPHEQKGTAIIMYLIIAPLGIYALAGIQLPRILHALTSSPAETAVEIKTITHARHCNRLAVTTSQLNKSSGGICASQWTETPSTEAPNSS